MIKTTTRVLLSAPLPWALTNLGVHQKQLLSKSSFPEPLHCRRCTRGKRSMGPLRIHRVYLLIASTPHLPTCAASHCLVGLLIMFVSTCVLCIWFAPMVYTRLPVRPRPIRNPFTPKPIWSLNRPGSWIFPNQLVQSNFWSLFDNLFVIWLDIMHALVRLFHHSKTIRGHSRVFNSEQVFCGD